MTAYELEIAVGNAEAALPPDAVRACRSECGWSGPVLMPTRHELIAYLVELRREIALRQPTPLRDAYLAARAASGRHE
jgi:hypothetical protein